jgi:hypothetical protein
MWRAWVNFRPIAPSGNTAKTSGTPGRFQLNWRHFKFESKKIRLYFFRIIGNRKVKNPDPS